MKHAAIAFLSGVVVEALYALGVILIGERQGYRAGLLSTLWGAAFLAGVNESFQSWFAAACWCVGLGVGTVVGVNLKPAGKPGKETTR